MATLRCFKCHKDLKAVFDGDEGNHPDDGVIFETHGNYGSTVFDEIDGAKLVINICDKCLLAGKSDVLHIDGIPKRKWKPWVPDHEEQS